MITFEKTRPPRVDRPELGPPPPLPATTGFRFGPGVPGPAVRPPLPSERRP